LFYNKSSYVWIVFGIAELFLSFQTTTVTEAQIVPHNKEGEMNEHVSDSKQMTCSGINKFRKGYQFTTLLAWGFCRLPQPEYVEFKTLTVSKSIHPSPIILRVQMLLKTGIDT